MVTQTLKGNKKSLSEYGFKLLGSIESSISHGNIQFDSLRIFLALQYTAAYKSEIVTWLCIFMTVKYMICLLHLLKTGKNK